jgi:hydroxyacylglutathione hydrolase
MDLKPVRLVNTHCHLDHIYGNKFISDEYKLDLGIHEKELVVLNASEMAARMYGAKIPEKLEPAYFISENEKLELNDVVFDILFTPGHSPGSICFLNRIENYCIVGDVLFQNSIGRTDLPGGNHHTLIKSIETQLLVLDDAVEIYNGHGNQLPLAPKEETIRFWYNFTMPRKSFYFEFLKYRSTIIVARYFNYYFASIL